MDKNQNLEGRIFRVAALAIGGYLAFPIGGNVSAFLGSFFPYSDWVIETNSFWIRTYIPGLIGYSFTGFLLGLGLWLLFKNSARQLAIYLPIFLILGQWVRSYMAFSERGSGGFSPFGVLGYLLTSFRGFELLVVIPAAVFVTLWYFQNHSSGSDRASN